MGSIPALEAAKFNLDQKYSVVGVLELLDLSLKVFEKVLPKFFSGLSAAFETSKNKKINSSTKKEELSIEAIEVLQRNMSCEIELYNFAKSKLLKQALYLDISLVD